ncbi:acyl-CoA dehydrogenase [Rahnella variigena]|uniref:acyl-CoA dehydrogenase family protein n=1 Tax=Rahnella variigena TaxID=574964 RepID=UPI00101C6A4F|nr:acyl-CoA dehydrogenase [Rahnella variigena]RYJ11826.1 acyl-CoA dehydrogenase [Rahnella variigena]
MKSFYDHPSDPDFFTPGAEAQAIADQLRQIASPDETRAVMARWSQAPAFNLLGVPAEYPSHQPHLQDYQHISLTERYRLYEKVAFISPILMFSAPGPGMAAFAVAGLGTEQQQDAFFNRFQQTLSWSCFAMTEPAQGSDAGAMETTASPVRGGYRLCGRKMFIGNGMIADTGVIFARTAPGPLGINAFIFNPQSAEISRYALALNGLKGTNLAHMQFDDLFIPHADMLGRHLKPTERFAKSAIATFDALRPCVGALALGVARRAIHEWQRDRQLTLQQSAWLSQMERRWLAGYHHGLQVCQQTEDKLVPGNHPGMVKTHCVILAEELICGLIHRTQAGDMPLLNALWQAFRDVKAFEYTEGTRQIHRLNQGYSRPQEVSSCL